MKKLNSIILLLIVVIQLQAQKQKMDSFISNLMKKMTLEEKIGQLNQVAIPNSFVTGATVSTDIEGKIVAGNVGSILNSLNPEVTRKAQEMAITKSPSKIPILFGMDVIHGFRTIFPIPLALSCTWDMQLVEQSARIAAAEASSAGIAWTFSPMVDIARDARWGRIAEGAGEDPYLGSQVAAAMIKGYQGDDLAKENTILACVKHMALYGAAEAGRDYNTVDMSRLSMYQDYLPPYKAAVETGAGSAMTSFNVIDGIPATGNRWLLTELLRNQWKFDGFVVTDYTAIKEMTLHGMGDLQEVTALALKAGVDMDMVTEGFLNTLKKSFEEGKVTEDEINHACRRVLEAKYKLGLFDNPYRYINTARMEKETFSQANQDAARKIAANSVVLLKNDKQTLPLKKSGIIALVGPLADSKSDMLGTWAMGGQAEKAISLKEGLKNVGGNAITVLHAKGSEFTDDPYLMKNTPSGAPGTSSESKKPASEMIQEAVNLANQADVVVAAIGEPAAWSGEATSRTDISIPETQKNLLKALKATGKPVVVVIFSGRPLTLVWEDTNFDAILEAWQGGTQAGNAVADVLFGDYNPAGKLTATFPRSVGQIPIYYNHKNTGRPQNPNDKYTSKYIDSPNEPLYPFGYGLSYTSFEYGDISLSKKELKGDETLTVTIPMKNTGKFKGEEVVQLYISDPVATISRAVKELKGFQKIILAPGETKEVKFTVSTELLKFYNSNLEYNWEPGVFEVQIGGNSRDVKKAKFNWLK
ncbi:MAG TPA: beta-glucosidase BglX [Draconibacterium sp.]|nr:beta-glucosidase BglX [Draconibacterium sp.]